MATKGKTIVRHRSAVTGQFVTEKEAERKPRETIRDVMRRRAKR